MPIELHACDTPNGRKISVALEEMALPYAVRIVELGKRQQIEPEFLKISPLGQNKCPLPGNLGGNADLLQLADSSS